MSKRRSQKPLDRAPLRRRSVSVVPKQRPVAVAPKGDVPAHAPTVHVAKAPKELGVRKVPNPRLPRLVRDVRGGSLMDLFEILPDLPRLKRPPSRKVPRTSGVRIRRRR